MEQTATAFAEIVYIIVVVSYVSASKCYLNRLNLRLLFFSQISSW